MSARVLVVDDDDAFRYAAVKMLADAGFEAVEAPDYRQALDILDDKKPLELLLMDIMIPGVNGFALTRMARMRHRALKVVYVSAFDVPTAEALGPVLRKPIDGEKLLAEIRKVLADNA
jgi:two-component system OmpR family response regulator